MNVYGETTYRQNFTAWWEIYRATGDNKGVVERDYAVLDEVLPGRVRGLEEWMRGVGYTGERSERGLLKDIPGGYAGNR